MTSRLSVAPLVAAAGLGLMVGLSAPGTPPPPPERADGAVLHPTPLLGRLHQAAPTYDARFAFARVRYGSGRGGSGFFGRGFGASAWAHDYPAADENMQLMLNEFTAVRARTGPSVVLELEDDEIFRYPILYVSEPGYWSITEEGARNLRTFLLKGGFLMFDDFEGRQWDNMAAQVARALPEGQWFEVDASHPMFGTFFHVEDIYVPHPFVRVPPSYQVIFEDNDPSKRIMVLANHNSDLAEYWEYLASGYFPVDPTNDAFRLGINYIVYALTH